MQIAKRIVFWMLFLQVNGARVRQTCVLVFVAALIGLDNSKEV